VDCNRLDKGKERGVEMNNEKREKKTITVEPNWAMLFRSVMNLVNVNKPTGHEIIYEMLAYGMRLHQAREENLVGTFDHAKCCGYIKQSEEK
jgi:hypothetical protein